MGIPIPGASSHLTNNINWITDVCDSGFTKEIMIANQSKVSVECCGNIITSTAENNYCITVEKAVFKRKNVSQLATNLFSVSQLIKQGNKVRFTSKGCEILNRQNVLVATASLINGVYKLNTLTSLVAAAAESPVVWHRRLGHVNSFNMNKMHGAVEGVQLSEKANIDKSNCIVCCEGKQSRLPFAREGNRSTELLDVIHSDICGPMENTFLGGSRNFIIFVDDYSRMTQVYFLRSKDEALQSFVDYKAKVEIFLSKTIKTLRTDNGSEFCNRNFESFLRKSGIHHEKTNPYTPEQNGLFERMNRTLIEKARCLMFDAKLEYQSIYKKPEQCILVGYPEDVKGYRIYNPATRSITTSRDVIFIKENKLSEENVIEINEESKQSSSSVGDLSDTSSREDSFVSVENAADMDDTYTPSFEDEESLRPEENTMVRTLPKWHRAPPDRYGYLVTEECNKSISDELILEEALEGPQKEQWEQAIKEELKSFDDNKAWDIVDVPVSGNIVKSNGF